jgi:hypothetical protein
MPTLFARFESRVERFCATAIYGRICGWKSRWHRVEREPAKPQLVRSSLASTPLWLPRSRKFLDPFVTPPSSAFPFALKSTTPRRRTPATPRAALKQPT